MIIPVPGHNIQLIAMHVRTHILVRLSTLLLFLPLACSEAEREGTDSLPVDSVSFAPDSMPISSPPVLSYDPGCSDNRQYTGADDPEDFGISPKRYILRDLVTGRYHTIELCHGLLLLRDGETTLDTLGTLARKWNWQTYGQSLEVHDSIILANEAIGKGNSQSGDVQFVGVVNGRFRCLAELVYNTFNFIENKYYTMDYEVRDMPVRVYCREEYEWTEHHLLNFDQKKHVLYNRRFHLSNVPIQQESKPIGQKISGTFPGIRFRFSRSVQVYVRDQWCWLINETRIGKDNDAEFIGEDEDAEWRANRRWFSGEEGWECYCE